MTIASDAKCPSRPIPKNADKYFTNVRQALEFHNLNPIVKYRCFMRVDGIAVYKFVERFLASKFGQSDKYLFKRLHAEGSIVRAKDPIFELSGRMQDLVELETELLWYTGWPSLCALNAREIRSSAGSDIQLIDMAARHCPGAEAVEMASYAAHLGGFDLCSTDLGSETFNGEGVGSMPHAWIGMFPSTAQAAVAFAEAHPTKKIITLVDYYAQELNDAQETYHALGDKLYGVRIDTHGGRFCQGVTNTEADGDFAAITRMREEFGIDSAGRYDKYAYGKGVTVEAAYCLRGALDEVGGDKVRITVSSGFTPAKVRAFVDLNAPVDSIGTGSFLPTDIRDTYATMDIVAYDGVPKIKVGREWLL